MDASRLITRILGMLLRKGVSQGVRRASAPAKPGKDMTPQERQQAKAARENSRRAKQAMRVARRFGKF